MKLKTLKLFFFLALSIIVTSNQSFADGSGVLWGEWDSISKDFKIVLKINLNDEIEFFKFNGKVVKNPKLSICNPGTKIYPALSVSWQEDNGKNLKDYLMYFVYGHSDLKDHALLKGFIEIDITTNEDKPDKTKRYELNLESKE